MKVFISWSGSRSKSLANALRGWLPLTLNYVEPWVSDKDIAAGDRWAQSVAGELEKSNFGIICITPENLQSEWILFEAGALSKSMLEAKVIPLLFGLELSDLSGPLSQFQAQKVEQTGIMEVVRAINKVAETAVSEDIITRAVPHLWPALQDELEKIQDAKAEEKHMRPQHEILEELVTGVRGLNSRMREFDPEMIEHERFYRRKKLRFHPRIFEEFAMASRETEEPLMALLLIAGYLRDDFPWISEILAESYREIRDGGLDAADRVFPRLHRSLKYLTRGPMMREMMGGSKESMILMEELSMILDHVVEMSMRQNMERRDSSYSSSD